MADVAEALIVPDLGSPEVGPFLSALLVWDRVVVVRDALPSAPSEFASVMADATAHGVAAWAQFDRVSLGPKPESVQDAWIRLLSSERWDRSREHELMLRGRDVMRDSCIALAEYLQHRIRLGLRYAAAGSMAPLAMGMFAQLGAVLPESEPGAAISEAAVVSAAVDAVQISSETSLEEVLAFRSKYRPQIGRFRAAMVDLAESMRAAETPQGAASASYAVVRNRVEPALADLERELSRSRISYSFRMLLGATTVVAGAPLSPATAVAGGGAVATRSLSYALDRDKLVREHPLGFLQLARSDFGRAVDRWGPAAGAPILDPDGALVALFVNVAEAIYPAIDEMWGTILTELEA